nr:immunoglobulin heavy chain junction region [Mus musculus]
YTRCPPYDGYYLDSW